MRPRFSARHGTAALIREFIDDPDTWGGRVRRTYGVRMMLRLASQCPMCREADRTRLRLHRMHVAYGRRR